MILNVLKCAGLTLSAAVIAAGRAAGIGAGQQMS